MVILVGASNDHQRGTRGSTTCLNGLACYWLAGLGKILLRVSIKIGRDYWIMEIMIVRREIFSFPFLGKKIMTNSSFFFPVMALSF